MKPQDLRIGNLVKDATGEIFPVKSLDESMNGTMQLIEGIPLTPELLERFGFVKEFSKSFSSGNEVTFDIYRKGKFTYNSIQNQWWYGIALNAPLQYVHQLQNLYFAITGTELELKPSSSESEKQTK